MLSLLRLLAQSAWLFSLPLSLPVCLFLSRFAPPLGIECMPCLQPSLLLSFSLLQRSLLLEIKGPPPFHPSTSRLWVLPLSLHLLSFQPHLLRLCLSQASDYSRGFSTLLKSTSPNKRKCNRFFCLCPLSNDMTGCFNIRLLPRSIPGNR